MISDRKKEIIQSSIKIPLLYNTGNQVLFRKVSFVSALELKKNNNKYKDILNIVYPNQNLTVSNDHIVCDDISVFFNPMHNDVEITENITVQNLIDYIDYLHEKIESKQNLSEKYKHNFSQDYYKPLEYTKFQQEYEATFPEDVIKNIPEKTPEKTVIDNQFNSLDLQD